MSSHGSPSPRREQPPAGGTALPVAADRASPAVGITRGPDHVVELANPAARALLDLGGGGCGRPPLGRPIRELGAADYLVDLLDRVYAGDAPGSEPGVVLGSRLVDLFCEPLPARDGTRRLLVYAEDVTERRRDVDRLQLLTEAGPALLEASLERRDALDQAAQLAVRTLGELCVINLVQQDGSLVRAAVVHRDPDMTEVADELRRMLPLADSPNQRVLDTGEPLILRYDHDADPWTIAGRGRRELWDRLGLCSAVVVPIVARGRTLGTLSVSSRDPDRYSEADLELIEGLALRAGLALDTAELYHSERCARETADHAVANNAALLEVTSALTNALSPRAIAQVVVSQGAELLDAPSATLFLRVGDELELVHATGFPADVLEPFRRMPVDAPTASAEAARTGVPVWLESPDEVARRYPGTAAVHRGGGYAAATCLPLLVESRVVGTMGFNFTSPRRFGAEDRTFLLALANQCAQALDRARLYVAEQQARAAAERQRDRVAVLAEASLALDAPLSQDERLRQLTTLVVPRIADWCSVHLLRGGRVEQIAYAHDDPDKVAFVKELTRRYPPRPGGRDDPVAEVIRTGRPRLLTEVPDAVLAEAAQDPSHLELLRGLGIVSLMTVPLIVRGRTLGAITLVAAESGQRFGSEDLAFAQDLANRAALALDNARLYEEQHHIAATLQTALLPDELPEIPGVRLAGRYLAAGEANEVGGDLYDVFSDVLPGACAGTPRAAALQATASPTTASPATASPATVPAGNGPAEPGPWSLVISDVCGKGAAAAALTALIRYTVRTEASYRLAPGEVLHRLNRAIIHQSGTLDARFCTAIYGRLTPTPAGTGVALANAGHLPARILRRDGTIEVASTGGTILGVYAEPALARDDVHLGHGDTLLLITDGVTEARGADGFYGEDRLDALLTRCAGQQASSIASTIIDDVLGFQAGSPRDDIALLVVQAVVQVSE